MRVSVVVLSAVVFLSMAPSRAAGDVQSEMKTLAGRIQTKLDAGSASESDLAPELKQFDSILAEHSTEKTDDVAEVLFAKAMLYVEVFEDPAKGSQLLQELKQKFPNTGPAVQADQVLYGLQEPEAAAKIQAALKVGTPFPDFKVLDLNGQPLSVSALKGKVVLIDFWATLCGPCVAEMPNLRALYQKYHSKGFEIIGVSLDKDKAALTSFLEKREVTWPQYFDGLGWFGQLAEKYGVVMIPTNYLVDKNGVILGSDLLGADLDAAVAKAIGQK